VVDAMNIWLDDERLPLSKEWVWRKTAEETIGTIALLPGSIQDIQRISFDHDLGGKYTGYDVAKWIEYEFFNLLQHGRRKDFAHIQWDVHSANTPGRDRIRAAMKGIGTEVRFTKESE